MILHSSWIDQEKYFFSEIFFWTKLKTFEEWNPQGIERTDPGSRLPEPTSLRHVLTTLELYGYYSERSQQTRVKLYCSNRLLQRHVHF